MGLLYLSRKSEKFVVVTTGSGIGPCFRLIDHEPDDSSACRILWSMKDAERTYEKVIVDKIRRHDLRIVFTDFSRETRK